MRQVNNYIALVVLVLFLFSCGNKKKEPVVTEMPLVEVADTLSETAMEDTLCVTDEVQAAPEEEIEPADGYFDDFILHFAFDSAFQVRRINFPLPYYRGDSPLKIERDEWQHDSLFLVRSYYTMMLDNEEELELLDHEEPNSIQVDWALLPERQVKRYYFERIDGRWRLEAINLRDVPRSDTPDFTSFYLRFATDSLFQAAHVRDPLEFITSDPDDDFSIIESILDRNQWFAFKPELPVERLSNISYGQKNEDNSTTKVMQIKGVGNGFLNTLFFRKRAGKWELYKFEDTSN